MKVIFLYLMLICCLFSSCKTPEKTIDYKSNSVLEITQLYTSPDLNDDVKNSCVNSFSYASADSSNTLPPTIKPKSYKSEFPHKFSYKESKRKRQNKVQRINKVTDQPKPDSKTWQIILAIFLAIASITWLIFSTFWGFGIIGLGIAFMLFITAIKKFPAPEEPSYYSNNDSDKDKKPFNPIAKLALIFFLLSLGFMIAAIFIPILLIAAFLGFLLAFCFSILALFDVKKNGDKERGKLTAQITLVLSAIPTAFILYVAIAIAFFGAGGP